MISRIVALVLLVLFLPIFLLVAILIVIEDGMPFFFMQIRVGKDHKLFKIIKFRSMKKNAPNVPTHLLENPKDHLLKIGRFIRKTSLDELPNLINVIKGEMVFVGPRPALYNHKDLIRLRTENGVYSLKPGITGWAQINGRDKVTLEEKSKLEEEYLARRSWWFDMKIIAKTASYILFKRDQVTH